jgi:geranylgeranyl diphosphate synthase type II
VNLGRYNDFKTCIEDGLTDFLPDEATVPASLHQAMRYSACGGGKRLRGVLCLVACEMVGGDPQWALPTACGLEMIHAYSLIHDDLPCMDDDDLRRGKPTNHKVFGEAIALMAGTGLLTQAFYTIVRHTPSEIPLQRLIQVLTELAEASGSMGMLGGQVLDLEGEDQRVSIEDLQEIHRRKTGALIIAALRTGAIIGGATKEELTAMTEYGRAFGLAFQITDDLLDVTGTTDSLGKPAGSDEKNTKSTYPALYGIEGSKQMAQKEIDKACLAIGVFRERSILLRKLADYIVVRDH